METTLTLEMSLHCYHETRSEKLVDLLSYAGVGVSYQKTTEHINQIACGVNANIQEHNQVYIPPGICKKIVLFALPLTI